MEQIKKYKVIENYHTQIFSNEKQAKLDFVCDTKITYSDDIVKLYSSADGWSNDEYLFDTLEQAKQFIDEQTAKPEYVPINEEFEAYYYSIWQGNEDSEDYDIECTIDYQSYWEKEYKPCYSSEQVKDELYYYIENLNNKKLIELNNFIFNHQTVKTMHNCIDKLLEYCKDMPVDGDNISFDDMTEFIFWNDELDYTEKIKNILKLYNLK